MLLTFQFCFLRASFDVNDGPDGDILNVLGPYKHWKCTPQGRAVYTMSCTCAEWNGMEYIMISGLQATLSSIWTGSSQLYFKDKCWVCMLSARWGLCNIIRMVLRLVPHGLLVGGPPCGSWIYMNSGTSKRGKKRIFGDCRRLYVRNANKTLC